MKRILAFFLAIAAPMLGQATNPQNTFPNAVQSDSPSFWLNYNDSTNSFKDSVSGLTMGNSANVTSSVGQVPVSVTTQTGGAVGINGAAISSSGTLTQVQIDFGTAPASTSSLTIGVFSISGTTATPVSSAVVSVAAGSITQTFTTSISVTAGEYLGWWAASGLPVGAYGTQSGNSIYYSSSQSSFPSSSFTVSHLSNYGYAITGSVVSTSTSGAVTTQRSGFDYTNNAQFSAAFPYNGFSVAPNNTLGAFDWAQPISLMFQIDRLNWNRSGSLILASKGDLGTCAGVTGCSNTGAWWQLFLTQSGYTAEICFERNGHGSTIGGWGGTAGSQVCDTMDSPNGFNYNIIVEQGGATGLNGDLSMYLNGLSVGTVTSNTYQYGFGGYQVTTTAGGTGYANPTYFTSTGGGANCSVTGSIPATSGVLSTTVATTTYTTTSGCTSAPTIVLTSPTGTGWTYTVQASGASENSTSYPAMAPGGVITGVYHGIDSTDSTQTSTYVDEFAEFPSLLTTGQIANLFYTTKWYQAIAPIPANPPVVIFSDDGCGDADNIFSLLMLIRAQQAGLATLAGVESTILDGTSQAYYRQVLDQAGLKNVPVAADTGTAVGSGHCTSANITSYNASTAQTAASYETSTTMYRTIFAKYPSTPIYIANGGPLDGIAQFMASPADSISPLTGVQLWTQNGDNGGFLAVQGIGCCGTAAYYTYPADQTVLAGNGTTSVYGWNATPQSGGPGILASRTSKDPSWLLFNSLGSDSRSCWDCLTAVHAMFPGTDFFGGGVTIAIGGSGTGYAASTPFTSTGGGANCHVSGFMLSTGGVPSSIVGTADQPNTSPEGLGYGCYTAGSPPTINLVGATGTGATLTASTSGLSVCQGVSASGTQVAIAATPCTNFYTEWPQYNTVSGTPLFQWFINSLVDLVPVGQPRVP